MAVTTHILATYRGPGRVVRQLIRQGQREDRLLAYLMAACLMMFAGQVPRIARESHLFGSDLSAHLQAAALGWLLMAPLAIYLIAPISRLIGMALGGQGSWFGARLALIWALLAACPLFLLVGLVAGFIGPGPAFDIVGLAWLAVFAWFWIAGAVGQERAE